MKKASSKGLRQSFLADAKVYVKMPTFEGDYGELNVKAWIA